MEEQGIGSTPEHLAVSSSCVSVNTEENKHDSGEGVMLSDEGKPDKDGEHDENTNTSAEDRKIHHEADLPKAEPQDTALNKETDGEHDENPNTSAEDRKIHQEADQPKAEPQDTALNKGTDGEHDENTNTSAEDRKIHQEADQPKAEPQDTALNKETDGETMASPAEDSSTPVIISTTVLPSILNEADSYSHDNKIEASHTDGSTNNQSHDERKNKEDPVLPAEGSEASNDRDYEAEEDGKHKEEIEKLEEEPQDSSPKLPPSPKIEDEAKRVTPDDITAALDNRSHEAEEGSRRNLLIAVGVGVLILAILLPQLKTKSVPQEHSLTPVDIFNLQMNRIKSEFTHQRIELWNRSRIHLLSHLQSAHPTEPVSMILTAGLGAQQTLRCLARRLASAFSSAIDASILFIDGHGKADQDSHQVKLDIDRQLQGAFEGNLQAAVIHRFEELPPGSTLIFYRYCDHENAAYKKPLLVFTVLLEDQREIPADAPFNTVEEMVDDQLQKKFLFHSRPTSFDSMDRDKYGGLWSRISHLILPVAAEETIEIKGCESS